MEAEAPVPCEDGGFTDLQPLSDEQALIWKSCLDSKIGPRMLRALRLLLAGYAFIEVARMQGYKSQTSLIREATRLGVAGTTRRLMALQRSNTQIALEQIQDSLLDPNEKISAKERAIIAGIGHDKVVRSEERAQAGNQVATLASLLEKMIESFTGAGVQLRLEQSAAPEIIDVTPRRE